MELMDVVCVKKKFISVYFVFCLCELCGVFVHVFVCVCVVSDPVCLLVCVRIGVVCGCLGDNGEKVEMEGYKSDVTY